MEYVNVVVLLENLSRKPRKKWLVIQNQHSGFHTLPNDTPVLEV